MRAARTLDIGLWVLAVGYWLWAIGTLSGCTGTSLQNLETDAKYKNEQIACVDQAKTLDESHLCRCEVMTKYHRDCPIAWRLDAGSDAQ